MVGFNKRFQAYQIKKKKVYNKSSGTHQVREHHRHD